MNRTDIYKELMLQKLKLLEELGDIRDVSNSNPGSKLAKRAIQRKIDKINEELRALTGGSLSI